MIRASERSGQSLPRAVKSHRQGIARATEHLRGLRGLEPLPRDQQQQLAVALVQLGQRLRKSGIAAIDRDRRGTDGRGGFEPVYKGDIAASTPVLVREHPTGAPQQPRQRIRRHVIQTPPGDREHLARRIVRSRRVNPPARISPYRPVIRRKQGLKPRTTLKIIHTTYCPATPRELQIQAKAWLRVAAPHMTVTVALPETGNDRRRAFGKHTADEPISNRGSGL